MLLLGAVSALLIAAMLGAACYMWLATAGQARRSQARRRLRPASRPGPDAALRRHPAGRGRYAALGGSDQAGLSPAQGPRYTGPDDDPDFISALERLIRGGSEDPQP
jgi:hypothetical protein